MLDSVVGPIRESLVELLRRFLVLREALKGVEFDCWVEIHSCGDVYSFLGLRHASRAFCEGIVQLRICRQVHELLRRGVDGIEATFFSFCNFSWGLVSLGRLNEKLFVIEGKHLLWELALNGPVFLLFLWSHDRLSDSDIGLWISYLAGRLGRHLIFRNYWFWRLLNFGLYFWVF